MRGESMAVAPEHEPVAALWHDLGCCGQGLDGPAPLAWQEMRAMAELMRLELPPICWETVRAMSIAYISGWRDRRPLSVPPVERDA